MLRHKTLTIFFSTAILIFQLIATGDVKAADTYSLVLASAPGAGLKWIPKKSPLLKGRTIYTQEAMINGKQWERLCLGFFENREQAVLLLKEIKSDYPGAWIQKASPNDIKSTIGDSSPAPAISKPPTTIKSSLTEKQLDGLMQRAKADITKKDYASAVRYLTALIAAGEHKYSREALELLGLARQRKGQNAHAVDTYEKYLALYPDGDDSNRVRQRLAGLITASRPAGEKIRMSTTDEKGDTTTYGSLSQFYRNNKATIDGTDSLTTLSQLITFFDVTTVQNTASFNHRYQFTSDHTYDFLGNDNDSEFRFIEAYYELGHRKTGTSGKIGRQSLRIGGILKRFDGLSAGYQFTPDMRLNLLGGFPVETDDKTSINNDKTFYGLTYETGTFFEHWEMSPFYFEQKVNGLNDRNSTGTEVRYRDKNKSLFGMIDYDLFFNEIDIVQFNANLIFDNGRTGYMNAFMRKTPILATSNALIGRPETTLDELKNNLNVEQIYQLARDRTANSQTVTVGGTQQLDDTFQISTDITLSRVDSTIESGGVPATPGTGTDYFLSAQLVGNNLWMERDTGVLGLRYMNTEPSDTISLIANSRFPITKNWRINPRLQFDVRKLTDGRTQEKVRAIIKTDYRYLNKARFDFEIGYDDTTESNNGQSLGSNNLFITLGYRWDF